MHMLAGVCVFVRSDNITIPQLADRGALTVKVKRLNGEGPGHMKQQSPTPPVHLPLLDFLHPTQHRRQSIHSLSLTAQESISKAGQSFYSSPASSCRRHSFRRVSNTLIALPSFAAAQAQNHCSFFASHHTVVDDRKTKNVKAVSFYSAFQPRGHATFVDR